MTLVQFAGKQGLFVAVASDTRQVQMLGNDFIFRAKDSEGKSGRLSKFVLSGGGGRVICTDRLRELIVKYADEAEFLEDFVSAFERAIAKMRNEREFQDYVEEEASFQFTILGFNSTGTTGIATFVSGPGEHIHYEPFGEVGTWMHAIAPSTDEFDIIKAIDFREPKKAKAFPVKLIERFATVQQACYINDEDRVSEKCVYSVIFRNHNTREFQYFEGTVDLAEEK